MKQLWKQPILPLLLILISGCKFTVERKPLTQASVGSCEFNGIHINDGSSVTAYSTPSVPLGSTCVSEVRHCEDGELSGTYANRSCRIATAASCTLNDPSIPSGSQSIASGSSILTYQSSSVPHGSSCVSQSRSCSNGVLSGSYTKISCSVSEANTRNKVRLLAIGNSYAGDATRYLPAMATAAGKELVIYRGTPGGASLKRHADAAKAFASSPTDTNRIYSGTFSPARSDAKSRYALQEILAAETWDFVTIQQASIDSFKYETYEPHATYLIDTIRRIAPQAEILIHQTWAYREDYDGFESGSLTQQLMFNGLVSAYNRLAESHQLRIIPVGTAIQTARQTPRWTFQFPDPNFNYDNPQSGTKPIQTGSLNIGWTVSGGDASLDASHLNIEGQSLANAVFYGFLYGEKAANNSFVQTGVAPADALLLKQIADSVLESFEQN